MHNNTHKLPYTSGLCSHRTPPPSHPPFPSSTSRPRSYRLRLPLRSYLADTGDEVLDVRGDGADAADILLAAEPAVDADLGAGEHDVKRLVLEALREGATGPDHGDHAGLDRHLDVGRDGHKLGAENGTHGDYAVEARGETGGATAAAGARSSFRVSTVHGWQPAEASRKRRTAAAATEAREHVDESGARESETFPARRGDRGRRYMWVNDEGRGWGGGGGEMVSVGEADEMRRRR